MLVSWNQDLALGYLIVDDGHRLVIDCINRLNKAVTRAENDAEVAGMLPVLRTHLTEQFQHEEALMRLTHSARVAEHAAEHARLLEVLDAIRTAYANGTEVGGVLMLNLVCFLVSHLRGTDHDEFAPMPVDEAA